VDDGSADRMVHAGAVYVHQGRTYVVEALDLGEAVARVAIARDGALRLRAASGRALPPDLDAALGREPWRASNAEPFALDGGGMALAFDGPEGALRVEIAAHPLALRVLERGGRQIARLGELGFGVDVLEYDPCGEVSCVQDGFVSVHGFEDEEGLERLMRELPCEAIYSDLYADGRITRLGKVPFSLQAFEPGIQGAQRTAEKLIGACEMPFYRKYGRHGRKG